MKLARFPRLRITHAPTPLEPMPRLSERLGGPNLWIKRDDCTGLATGGNKTRKLEFLMADALRAGRRHASSRRARPSRTTRGRPRRSRPSSACSCHILLEDRTGSKDDDYKQSGNVLLDQLYGASIAERARRHRHERGDGSAGRATCAPRAASPTSSPAAAPTRSAPSATSTCALELIDQANDLGLRHRPRGARHRQRRHPGRAGRRLRGRTRGIPVLGIGVRAPGSAQEEQRLQRWREAPPTSSACRAASPRDRVVANCDYVGAGYGLPTPGMIEAVKLLARTEGILLDPVYSGKGMAGLIDLCPQAATSRTARTSCSCTPAARPGCSAIVALSHPEQGTTMLGILGGMGPWATADFFAKLIAETPARCDEEHVPVLLLSDPRIPPRPPAILGDAESPLPVLRRLRDRLIAAGATLLAMPCNTAHAWYAPLAQDCPVPFLSIVEAACDAVAPIAPPPSTIALIATQATLVSRIYEGPLAARGYRVFLPEAHEQRDGITPAIELVKRGDSRAAGRLLVPVIESLLARGADGVILGCTETPIALDALDAPVRARCVDANRALARRCIEAWRASA